VEQGWAIAVGVGVFLFTVGLLGPLAFGAGALAYYFLWDPEEDERVARERERRAQEAAAEREEQERRRKELDRQRREEQRQREVKAREQQRQREAQARERREREEKERKRLAEQEARRQQQALEQQRLKEEEQRAYHKCSIEGARVGADWVIKQFSEFLASPDGLWMEMNWEHLWDCDDPRTRDQGEWAIDLHGYATEDGRTLLDGVLLDAWTCGLESMVVIHGGDGSNPMGVMTRTAASSSPHVDSVIDWASPGSCLLLLKQQPAPSSPAAASVPPPTYPHESFAVVSSELPTPTRTTDIPTSRSLDREVLFELLKDQSKHSRV
jgi:hypothetical protein